MGYNFNAGEVFKIAVQIEENGKRFYEKALQIVGDEGVKALFKDLAAQEVEHKKKFESLAAQLPSESTRATVWDPDNEMEQYIKMMADQHVFVSSDNFDAQMAQVKDVISALKLAINFEKDSVLFFLTLEDATDGKKDQEFIHSLVREEQDHLKRLSLELKRVGR